VESLQTGLFRQPLSARSKEYLGNISLDLSQPRPTTVLCMFVQVLTFFSHIPTAWTHLHPHFFMDNPLAAIPVVDGRLFMGNQPVGWIAPEDVAAVAANVLSEGPEQHGDKQYWLFTEMLNGTQAAVKISKGLGRPVERVTLAPDHMAANGKSGAMKLPSFVEPTYGASILDWVRQSYD
jgi:NAD(P)H dehydrogenase (quinone)